MLRTLMLIGCMGLTACGGGGQPDASSPDAPAGGLVPAQVSVMPSAATIGSGGNFQFSATVQPGSASNSITWSVTGPGCSQANCGAVDVTGRYVAPDSASAMTVTVTATSTVDGTKSAAAVVTISPQAAGTFTRTGDMSVARVGHTATLLADGRVLIVGGELSYLESPRPAELYDPATGTFVMTGSINVPRGSHSAALLPNGQVLIVGPEASSGAELYDPVLGAFFPAAAHQIEQHIWSATSLANGKVLVAGDVGAELFDPTTGTFQRAAGYAAKADGASATLLADGRVLFVGGNRTQLYDPVRDVFSTTGSLDAVGIDGIELHSAVLLTNGQVLIAGGANDEFHAGRLDSAELYDPTSGAFSATGSLLSARSAHAAVRLADGQVLVLGGDGITCGWGACYFAGSLARAELYSPGTGLFAAVGDMNLARTAPTATLLKNGDVLIAGGLTYCGIGCYVGATATAEVFRAR